MGNSPIYKPFCLTSLWISFLLSRPAPPFLWRTKRTWFGTDRFLSFLAFLALAMLSWPGEGRHWEGGGDQLSDQIHWNLARWESSNFVSISFSGINHNVDELLVGLVTQIHLRRREGSSKSSSCKVFTFYQLKQAFSSKLPPLRMIVVSQYQI